MALARADLARDDSARRIEGIELLALIGTPALPALRAAFERREQDLRATLSCVPDEPPRVTDQVPCVLLVTNLAKRRIALAPPPGDPEVRLTREDDLRAASKDDPGRPLRLVGARPADLVDRVLDLAPGEALRREFKIGPVRAAGRYEVRAILNDLGAALGSAGPPSPGEVEPTPAPVPPKPRGRSAGPAGPAPSVLPSIQATTVVRFEQ